MLVGGGLGFQSLVLVACLLFPLIVFLFRHKWRLAAVRQEEVRRLLALAAEEAARVESEDTFIYTGVAISGTQYCAVCYIPTTTRCARCKLVRYCSGKCQIIHWRQGHKDECYPPTEADFNSNFECFTDAPGGKKDEDTKSEFFMEESKTDLGSESPATSFSGFSSSLSSSESSDNLSDSEGSIQTINERCGGHLFARTSFDNLGTTGIISTDDRKLSPKGAALVNSVDTITEATKLNRRNLAYRSQDSYSISNSSVFRSNGKCVEPCTFRSDVGVVDTDFIGSKNNTQGNTTFSGFNPAKKDVSGLQSSLCFSFDPAGNAVPSHLHVLKTNNNKLDESLPISSQNNKPLVRQTVSDDDIVDSLKRSNSLYTHEVPKKTNNSNSCKVNLREGESVLSSSSTANRNSRNLCDSNTSILPPLKSEKPREVVYDQLISSSMGSQIVPPTDSGKVNSKQARSSSRDSIFVPNSMNGLKTSVSKVFDQFKGSKSKHVVAVDDKTGRPPGGKEVVSYELFVKLYYWNKVELQPSGLINCGNSCYANVVLQCLAFTPPLTAYFLLGFHSKTCRKRGWCFSCDFENLILEINEGKSPLSPAAIISQLRNIGSHLSYGREEDAHEFLRYVIDTMRSVSLVDPGVSAAGIMEEETSLVGLTFGGYLLSKIECTKCHGKSECQERILDLTVEIEGDIKTLEEALHQYTSTEVLDENNKYQCSRCKCYVRAKKKLTVLEAPNVLTIALKRFQPGKFGKLNKSIKFPDILNLAPFLSGTSDKSPIYKLYAVVDHLDVMNAAFSGHYVCYVKNVLNKWFKIDDSTVTAVEPANVLSKGAYMLFYSRCSPRAPKLTRNRILTSDSKIKISHSPINKRSISHKSRSISTHSISNGFSGSDSPFWFHGLQRVLDDDSLSDSSSLFSVNSDEGSSSSFSTQNSSSSFEDLSDYIFGNTGRGLNTDPTSSNYDPSSFQPTHLPLPDRPEKRRDRLNSSDLWTKW